MKVTVMGGGNGCFAAVAQLSENGHDVCWWRRDGAAHQAVADAGGFEVRDRHGARHVPFTRLSADLEAAVGHGQLIVIPLPATTHADLAPRVAPFLKSGQVVLLCPGTFGSYLFAQQLHRVRPGAEVCFAETGTLPYLARKHGATQLVISGYATRLPTGVFPAANTGYAISVLEQAYPAVERCEDALSGALMNAGPIIHPPLILMNAGPLEHFPSWDIHNEGTQPSVRQVTDRLDDERIGLREALGYGPPHFPLRDHYSVDGDEWMYGYAAHDELVDSGDWREHIDLRAHRYMTEDTALGLSFLSSAGRWAQQPMPLTDGLLAVGSAIMGTDLYANGRTLENIGLSALPRERLVERLAHGLG
ncbi:MAG: NAD/NADP octopine/nopaline dehydrogenase family protein [Gammaproteobacteria bacterium]|nr:NAD/NADP octopine/nopaline dehydrogenase family protein [Gammaproteobacteria bacterium]